MRRPQCIRAFAGRPNHRDPAGAEAETHGNAGSRRWATRGSLTADPSQAPSQALDNLARHNEFLAMRSAAGKSTDAASRRARLLIALATILAAALLGGCEDWKFFQEGEI
jgi:hypothetical protein